MAEAVLVPITTSRAAVTGLALPAVPPARIYISGFEYKLQSPKIALPPLVNAVKVVLNWALPAGRIAKNILHLMTGSSFVPSDPAKLQLLADALFTTFTTGSSAVVNSCATTTSLTSVTCSDMGGTTAKATSTHAPVLGTVTGLVLPPQVAMCISWQIAASYRGGKPRTYVPGIPAAAQQVPGGSAIDPTFATAADGFWTAAMNSINTMTVTGGGSFTLGTVSYFHAHSVRPTPLFQTYLSARVHERLDSQRRRNGPESQFAVTP